MPAPRATAAGEHEADHERDPARQPVRHVPERERPEERRPAVGPADDAERLCAVEHPVGVEREQRRGPCGVEQVRHEHQGDHEPEQRVPHAEPQPGPEVPPVARGRLGRGRVRRRVHRRPAERQHREHRRRREDRRGDRQRRQRSDGPDEQPGSRRTEQHGEPDGRLEVPDRPFERDTRGRREPRQEHPPPGLPRGVEQPPRNTSTSSPHDGSPTVQPGGGPRRGSPR